jgi:hypothetical protein
MGMMTVVAGAMRGMMRVVVMVMMTMIVMFVIMPVMMMAMHGGPQYATGLLMIFL